jgi:hypothetical protein
VSYDYHRAYTRATTIEWRGKSIRVSQELHTFVTAAKIALMHDGPFPPLAEEVDLPIDGAMYKLDRKDVDELFLGVLKSSILTQQVQNARAKGIAPPAELIETL